MKWTRVNKRKRCPICDHAEWCLISPDGYAVLCMRLASDREKRLKDGSIGWIHRIGIQPQVRREYAAPTAAEVIMDWPTMMARYEMDTSPVAVAELAASLGVDTGCLAELQPAWCRRFEAWAFPMQHEQDGFWEVCGIRLRSASTKWSIRGSHAGLFIPKRLRGDGPILICEGPTDTAAMLTLGFDAVGRPSCQGCIDLIQKFLKGTWQEVVICSDTDTPGRLGAATLALEIRRKVKVISPLKGKDVRAWKQAGATREVILSVIRNTRFANLAQVRRDARLLRERLTSMARSRTGANASSTKEEISTCLSGASPAGNSS